MLATILLVLQALTPTISGIQYVTTTYSSSSNCPGQPCLTLDQYLQQTTMYFTTGSTFVFLPGNHSTKSAILLANTSNITLTSIRYDSNATIICNAQQTIIIENASNMNIEWLIFDLTKNQIQNAEALKISNSTNITISNCIFQENGDFSQRRVQAIHAIRSNINISGSVFKRNTGYTGGAIHISHNCTLILSRNTFVGNKGNSGGGIYASIDSTVLLTLYNEFSNNVAVYNGGAIECLFCFIKITGDSSFRSNTIINENPLSGGGAIHMRYGYLSTSGTLTFINNTALQGGGIYLEHTTGLLQGDSIIFFSNSAEWGGGMSIRASSVTVNADFTSNFAERLGGGLNIGSAGPALENIVEISGKFTHNRAECGGAISVQNEKSVSFKNIKITNNSGSALCISAGNVTFTGSTQLLYNRGTTGGGIRSEVSHIIFSGATLFDGNTAQAGGAIHSIQGEIAFHNNVLFTHNIADSAGGAMYSVGSNIIATAIAEFDFNSAKNGGVLYLSEATLTLTTSSVFSTSNNSATEYGGVIYYNDNPTTAQCNYTAHGAKRSSEYFMQLKQCFLQLGYYASINSNQDSAGKDGNFLYGGLLDKCRSNKNTQVIFTLYTWFLWNHAKITNPKNKDAKDLSSDPYELCFCKKNSLDCNSNNRSTTIKTIRGQTITTPLLALAQGTIATATHITATTQNSRLMISQNTQNLPEGCFDISYNLYSAETSDKLILYPDGPCRDNGLARVIISVTFLPCPAGFNQSGEVCICEDRLNKYVIDCSIGDSVQFVKRSNFWMSALLTNGLYEGLILYESCPAEYCKTQAVIFTLEDLDAQCDINRSGVLCGQCISNYSLMLGSSRCEHCSNHSLALILAFAAAGLALVAFLTLLKLTVATGTLNSLILYANVLQANIRLLLPLNKVNVLTVFIAWLNLDLGIETCFYDGMTAYVQTWLQFVFPMYVWILISGIIFSARYSVFLSRLIGSDPIAVLATLLLMSYTKILRVIIEVYSYIDLDYPGEERVRVWLKDGNVPYLSSGHLVLTVVTSLVLVLFFLPYTLLLLLGYRLYPFTGRKHFHWFSRIKPFLESYYAPYKPHTRYWTGFLLLVRWVLYIVFAFNSLGGTRKSLLAISLTFTALAIVGSGRIYKRTVVNVVEMFVYFNLAILSTATLAQYKWPALVYSLIGMVLAILVCAATYQFYSLYIAKTRMWLRIKTKLSPYFQRPVRRSPQPEPHTDTLLPNPSHDPHKIVSKTVFELREPLLET